MFFTASIIGFFRLVFWLFLGMYLFRMLSRWLLPWILKTALENRQKKYHSHSKKPFSKSKTGKTTIDKKPPAKKSVSDGLGDYIKYEEIDEH